MNPNHPSSFEHVTLNTGHVRHSPASEMFPRSNLKLLKIAAESLKPDGIEVDHNIIFRATKENDMYIGTLFYRSKSGDIPFIITGGAKTEQAGKILWKEIHTFQDSWSPVTKIKKLPSIPFVADRLLSCIPIQAYQSFIFTGMSGDFCRCMGWAFLFPEMMVPHP